MGKAGEKAEGVTPLTQAAEVDSGRVEVKGSREGKVVRGTRESASTVRKWATRRQSVGHHRGERVREKERE